METFQLEVRHGWIRCKTILKAFMPTQTHLKYENTNR